MNTKQSYILSNRTIQPGHCFEGAKNEDNFEKIFKEIIEYCENLVLLKNKKIVFPNKKYFLIDFVLKNTKTNKYFYFEVKRQGDKGNAHERVYKYFVPRVQEFFKRDPNYCGTFLIACDGLAKNRRYKELFENTLEENQVFYYKKNEDLIDFVIKNKETLI